jgi:hypothetical protein
MLPESHLGKWTGPNRLWMEPGTKPEPSDGQLELSATRISYEWAFRGKKKEGTIDLYGPALAVRAAWTDTFHAENGMAMNGYFDERVLHLFGTYPAGDGPEWGWRIELDLRDPEHAVMFMFNLEPTGAVVPAVHLFGTR